MWKISATLAVINYFLATVHAGQSNYLTEYTIDLSSPVGSYHYPVPEKSQQLHDPISIPQAASRAAHSFHNQYQGNYHFSYAPQHSSATTKQFISPTRNSAALSTAMIRQGYKYRSTFRVSPRSSKTNLKTPAPPPPPPPPSSTATTASLGSLNVKLPLPLGVTPLNIAPLPLQAGTPYAAIANRVTSYGTLYPLRR